ncbi:MAG: molybdopterin-dependent oxidoreductase [Candidatus Nanopelagicales bacterium]
MRRFVDPLLGILAAWAGIAVGSLVAVWLGPAYAPVEVVASTAIDIPPAPVKEWATSTFGTAAKSVVLAIVVLAVIAIAAWAGAAARRRLTTGVWAMFILGLVGATAALIRPVDSSFAPVPSIVAGIVAAGALAGLILLSEPRAPTPVIPLDDLDAPPVEIQPTVDRRNFLLGVGGVFVLAAAATASARWLGTQASAVASRLSAVLPSPAQPLSPVPAGVQAPVAGMPPFITPNADFYRIDTAVVVPQVQSQDWSLTIDGMVGSPVTITYEELLAMPMVERDVTIMCVSNPVGGDYIGNARWLGTPLMPLLERAGIDAGADQLLSASVDGWTCSTPIEGLADREPLLVIGMNGEPLPIEHGFPVRMVIPGLYGFISATKWVTRIEATTYAAQPAYWTVRGWATDAPVLTSSRIDVPGGEIAAGPVQLGGLAWAMDGDGVSAVQVRIDEGDWQDAQLAEQLSPVAWRQWWIDWDASAGEHSVAVRAVNGRGEVQTGDIRDVIPDGATGYDIRTITVV